LQYLCQDCFFDPCFIKSEISARCINQWACVIIGENLNYEDASKKWIQHPKNRTKYKKKKNGRILSISIPWSDNTGLLSPGMNGCPERS
jgi:hypothetical protein